MSTRVGAALLVLLLAGALSFAPAQEKVVGPVRVKIEDERSPDSTPIDPITWAECRSEGFGVGVSVENQSFNNGLIYTCIKIDQSLIGQEVQSLVPFVREPGAPSTLLPVERAKLPRTRSNREGDGFTRVADWRKVHIVQTGEVIATRPEKDQRRRRDAVLVRYLLENQDSVSHQVGVRCSMDVCVLDNDAALFAVPNQPGKILDGVEIKGKMMPAYVQLLEKPNIQDPGFVGHLAFDLGPSVEAPNRLVLTNWESCLSGHWHWDIAAVRASHDSGLAFYWEPLELKPGAKRVLAYALGQGLASRIEGDGTLKVDLVGSFEPSKMFTIHACVHGAALGQSLTLELPDGLRLLEGKTTQPVPAGDTEDHCLVQWKARVPRPGQYHLRIHSSTGVTQSRIITVSQVTK